MCHGVVGTHDVVIGQCCPSLRSQRCKRQHKLHRATNSWPPRGQGPCKRDPHPEETALLAAAPEIASYVEKLKRRGRKVKLAVPQRQQKADLIELLERNRRRFGMANLHIHAGDAPEGLAQLPPNPDRVLLEVGRPLRDVLVRVWRALQPGGRLVISTASLEGLVDATDTLGHLQARDVQVVQATVHRMQRRGSQAKLAAAEPLFLIAAERPPHTEPA